MAHSWGNMLKTDHHAWDHAWGRLLEEVKQGTKLSPRCTRTCQLHRQDNAQAPAGDRLSPHSHMSPASLSPTPPTPLPLPLPQGKPQAIARIRQSQPYNTIAMVGDGITDLEAVQVGRRLGGGGCDGWAADDGRRGEGEGCLRVGGCDDGCWWAADWAVAVGAMVAGGPTTFVATSLPLRQPSVAPNINGLLLSHNRSRAAQTCSSALAASCGAPLWRLQRTGAPGGCQAGVHACGQGPWCGRRGPAG